MKIETIEKLKELVDIDANLASLQSQRAALKTTFVELTEKRMAIIDEIHSDESVARDLYRRKPRTKKEPDANPDGTPGVAKKRGK